MIGKAVAIFLLIASSCKAISWEEQYGWIWGDVPTNEIMQWMSLPPQCEGRQKAQWVALLVLNDDPRFAPATQHRACTELFVFSNTTDSAFLEERLPQQQFWEQLSILFKEHGALSYSWLVSKYPSLPPMGKAGVISAMHWLEYREVYAFLIGCLQDDSVVYDDYAEHNSSTRVIHKRISDYAYSSLRWRIKVRGIPISSSVPDQGTSSLRPLPERDVNIAALKVALTNEPAIMVAVTNMPSVTGR